MDNSFYEYPSNWKQYVLTCWSMESRHVFLNAVSFVHFYYLTGLDYFVWFLVQHGTTGAIFIYLDAFVLYFKKNQMVLI